MAKREQAKTPKRVADATSAWGRGSAKGKRATFATSNARRIFFNFFADSGVNFIRFVAFRLFAFRFFSL